MIRPMSKKDIFDSSRRSPRLRHAAILSLFLVSCSSSPPPSSTPPAVVSLPDKQPSAASTIPPAIQVATAVAPNGLSVDGDTAEWKLGTLQGSSKLALAVTGKAVFVAAELGHPSPEGFWLGVGSPASPMLPLSEWAPGGNTDPIDCSKPGRMKPNGIWFTDEFDPSQPEPPAIDPKEKATCDAMVAKHAQRQAEYRKRFYRLLRIEATGVRRMDENGHLVAIAEAKVAWKASASGATAEISMPVTVLPRLVEAPVTRLHVLAAPASDPAPAGPPDDEAKARALPAPVSFEPLGALRERAFAGMQPPIYMASSRYEMQLRSAGLSYDLANPQRIEWVRFGKTAQTILVEDEPLYEKKASLGDIEVGHLRAFREWFVISKRDAIVDLVELREGLRAVVVRDGEIHAISFTPSHYTMAYSADGPSWNVIAIGPDGGQRNPVEYVFGPVYASPKDGGLGCANSGPLGVMTGAETASAAFDTFGWKGSCDVAYGDAQSFEATWKWDAQKKQYAGVWKKLGSAPKPKKKP